MQAQATAVAIPASGGRGKPGRPPNRRLAGVMAEARLSRKALARRVRTVPAELGTPVAADHTAVSRWLDGTVPRPDTAQALAVVLGRALRRVVTLADIGLEAAAGEVDAGELRRRLDWLAAELASVNHTLDLLTGGATPSEGRARVTRSSQPAR